MNSQTPGPLAHHKAKIGILPGHTIETANGLSILAFVYGINNDDTGNAALFTAAYTAFDRAGRELGLDATELAKSLDVAALVKYAAGQVVTAGDLHARKALEGLWAAITQTPVGA